MTMNKEELHKRDLDAIIYGSGFALVQEDGKVRHINPWDVYILPSGDDDEHKTNTAQGLESDTAEQAAIRNTDYTA